MSEGPELDGRRDRGDGRGRGRGGGGGGGIQLGVSVMVMECLLSWGLAPFRSLASICALH